MFVTAGKGISPCSTFGVVKERIYIMRKTILCAFRHSISLGDIKVQGRWTAEVLLYVPESDSRAVSTASDIMFVSQYAF